MASKKANTEKSGSKRAGVIDVGTNSVLLLAAEVSETGKMSVIIDEARVSRLGEGLNGRNVINNQAVERTINVLNSYMNKCADNRVEDIHIIGTEVFRRASNTAEVQEKIRGACGIPVDVLPFEKEAKLSYLSALPETIQPGKKYLVIDIGGGSTEIAVGTGTKPEYVKSLPIGGVTLTGLYLDNDPPYLDELTAMNSEIARQFKQLATPEQAADVFGIGGTVTTIAAVHKKLRPFDPVRIEGMPLTRREIDGYYRNFCNMRLAERESLKGMEPGRADIIIAGTAILLGSFDYSGAQSITVSARGVRYGYMMEILAL